MGGAAEAHLRTDLGLAATGGASKHAGPVTFILIVAAVLSLPCLVAGLPGDQDGLYHVSNQRSFTRNFWSGDLYPRWLAEVNAGAGSPIMYILYPAPYFAAALLSPLLPDSVGQPTASLAAGLVAGVAMIASGLAAWLWLRTLVMPWAAAFGAVSYMLLPYHFAVDLYSRAAVGEHAAFVWLPLLMMFAGRRVADKTCDIVGAGVGFALLVLCHLFTDILFLPVAAAYCALRSQGRPLQSLLRFSAALALGAALAGVCLVPLVAHQPSFDHRLLALDSSGNFDYRHHFAFFTEGFLLYAGELAARLRIPASLLGLLPAVTAGLCAAAAAGSAVAAGRIRPVAAASLAAFVAGTLAILALPPAEPLWRAAGFLRPFEFAHSLFASKVFFTTAATAMLAAAAAAGALLRLRALALLLMATAAGATFMTLPWSLPVWEAIPSLANLDFPWRFNTLITFAAAILISLSLDSLLRIRTRAALTAALALCSAAILASVVNATLLNVQSRFLHPHRFADKQGIETLLPTYAKSTPVDWVRRNQATVRRSEFVQPSAAGVKTVWRRASARSYEIDIDAPETAALKIRQLYYPAWKAVSDTGRNLPLKPSQPEGYLMFDVGPGAHRVTLRFGATPSEILGGYISLGALVLLGAAVAKKRVRRYIARRHTLLF